LVVQGALSQKLDGLRINRIGSLKKVVLRHNLILLTILAIGGRQRP
jgi:hypothetical protein